MAVKVVSYTVAGCAPETAGRDPASERGIRSADGEGARHGSTDVVQTGNMQGQLATIQRRRASPTLPLDQQPGCRPALVWRLRSSFSCSQAPGSPSGRFGLGGLDARRRPVIGGTRRSVGAETAGPAASSGTPRGMPIVSGLLGHPTRTSPTTAARGRAPVDLVATAQSGRTGCPPNDHFGRLRR